MSENGHESNLYRVVIRMDHKTNAVSFEPHSPEGGFPAFLMQMILAEAQRQLEVLRKPDVLPKHLGTIEFSFEITFDAHHKRVNVEPLGNHDIPIAQMVLDEVIRLVNEQRSYMNVKITQQRLAEEATAMRLASSLRV
jgi:hypothetical protein